MLTAIVSLILLAYHCRPSSLYVGSKPLPGVAIKPSALVLQLVCTPVSSMVTRFQLFALASTIIALPFLITLGMRAMAGPLLMIVPVGLFVALCFSGEDNTGDETGVTEPLLSHHHNNARALQSPYPYNARPQMFEQSSHGTQRMSTKILTPQVPQTATPITTDTLRFGRPKLATVKVTLTERRAGKYLNVHIAPWPKDLTPWALVSATPSLSEDADDELSDSSIASTPEEFYVGNNFFDCKASTTFEKAPTDHESRAGRVMRNTFDDQGPTLSTYALRGKKRGIPMSSMIVDQKVKRVCR